MNKSIFESKEFLELMKKEEFIKEISNKKTKEEIKDAFFKNGVKMTDEDLKKFAEYLEKIYVENVSGGKKLSESVGDFIDKHPWLTFFTVSTFLCAIPNTIYAIRGKSTINTNDKSSRPTYPLTKHRN